MLNCRCAVNNSITAQVSEPPHLITPPTDMVVCSGCRQSFSIIGYTQHVYLTSCPDCIEAHEWNLQLVYSKERSPQQADSFVGYDDGYDEYDDGEYSNGEYDDREHEETTYEHNTGDDDNNYSEDEHNDNEHGDDEHSNSGTMEIDLPDEPTPHPQNEPTTTTSGDPQNNMNINLEITEFPLKSAGALIIDGTHQQTHYEAYHTRMGVADNTYAPFCSRMDWEIACWAKIHGPSSKAVSELLAIDGVHPSFSIIHYITLTYYLLSAS